MKPEGYYGQDRAELVRLLPRPLGRVLDVGCGEGATGRSLRAAGASWLAGIEPDAEAAGRAAEAYDEVRVGRVEETLGDLSGPFDTILLYDVLEHLPEPSVVLLRLHDVAAPGTRLHVSIPNARHWSLVRDLVLRGSFGYGDAGHRDRTHLRWFTKRDLVELLEETGWSVDAVAHGELRPFSRLLGRVTRGLSAEFLVYQLSALARESGSAPAARRAGAA